MKKVKCPCCGNYTHDEELHLFQICEVCFWQYDEVAHEKQNLIIGANHISLDEAKKNYKEFGVCKRGNEHLVRKPLEEELPENN